MIRRNSAPKILNILKKTYPDANCALAHETPLQLLVSTILSAQCTDKRVNMVTPALFRKYRTAEDFAGCRLPELEKEIHSTGFFRNKTKSIQGACRLLVEKYKRKIPCSQGKKLPLKLNFLDPLSKGLKQQNE